METKKEEKKSEWEKVKDLERDEEAVKRGTLLPKWVLKEEYMVKPNPFTWRADTYVKKPRWWTLAFEG